MGQLKLGDILGEDLWEVSESYMPKDTREDPRPKRRHTFLGYAKGDKQKVLDHFKENYLTNRNFDLSADKLHLDYNAKVVDLTKNKKE